MTENVPLWNVLKSGRGAWLHRRQFVSGLVMRPKVLMTSPKRISDQGLGKSKTLRVVGTPESKEKCWHTIVTFPAKRVNITTPRLHQSTTWVYASPLRISGATKHGKKRTVRISAEIKNLTITQPGEPKKRAQKLSSFIYTRAVSISLCRFHRLLATT